MILADFNCPVHGLFEAMADAGADFAPCPVIDLVVGCSDSSCCGNGPQHEGVCELEAPWVPAPVHGSVKIVSVVTGKSDPRPHAGIMNTEPIANGMSTSEWRAQRAEYWHRKGMQEWKDKT